MPKRKQEGSGVGGVGENGKEGAKMPRRDRGQQSYRETVKNKVKVMVQGNKKNMRFSQLNVDGYDDSSRVEVVDYMNKRRPDCMGLVETKLRQEEMENDALDVPGYKRFESRRSDLAGDRGGGGIMMYVRTKEGLRWKEHSPKVDKENREVEKERKWMIMKTDKYETAVCCVYLSHQTASDRYGAWNERLFGLLSKEAGVLRNRGMRIIMMGDWNGWVGSKLGEGVPGNDERINLNGRRFLQFLEDTNMFHLNGHTRRLGDWSSRISEGIFTRHNSKSSSTIDFICMSKEHQGSAKSLYVDEEGKWGGDSDHCILEANVEDSYVRVEEQGRKSSKPGWNFDEDTDWSNYKETVRASMGGLDESSVDGLFSGLAGIAFRGMESVFGVKKENGKRPKQFPKEVLNEIEVKRKLKGEWRKSRSALSRRPLDEELEQRMQWMQEKFEVQKAKVDLMMDDFFERERGRFLKKLSVKSSKSNKLFWRSLRAVSKPPAGFSGLVDPDTGELKIEQKEMLEIVQDFLLGLFEGSLGQPPGRPVEEGDLWEEGEGDGDVEGISQVSRKKLEDPFEESEVEAMVKVMKNCKAEGVDRIPAEALKNAPQEFIKKITMLFNMIKETGQAPEGWKTGRVVLIHKAGPEELLSNFRPLTIIVAFCGLFSRVLNDRLTGVVEEEDLLGEVQSGFRKTRSGSDNLFVLNTILWKAAARRMKAHLAFIDLKKAYDTVSREKLWGKLQRMGIDGSFLGCLKALYTGDKFVTEVNGDWILPIYLGRGLKQGCSLSPILFALYVAAWGEDLEGCREGFKIGNLIISVLFFADDIILISSTPQGLHRMLASCERHSRLLRMSISEKKSMVISASSDAWILSNWGGEVVNCLAKVAVYKYLGLEMAATMGRTINFKSAKCINMARRYQAVIRNFSRRGPDVMDMVVACWRNVAIPGITYGLESIILSETTCDAIQRIQAQLAKRSLGLPITAHNASAEILLGLPRFQEVVYNMQLKFYIRVLAMDPKRFAYQAMMEHMNGGWASKYLEYLTDVRMKLGAVRLPASPAQVEELTRSYFLADLNRRITSASTLEGMRPVEKLVRARNAREGENWAWITRAKMGACGLRARRGEVFKQLCFSCSKALTEQHTIGECGVVVRARMSTGIASFFNLCQMRGLSLQEAFRNFVDGLDSRGNEISILDYEERGRSIKTVIEARLSHRV